MNIFTYRLEKILEQEQERIFLWLPVVFGAGIACYFCLPFEPSLWLPAVTIELLIIAAYMCRHQPEKLQILGWLAVFVLGFTNIQIRAHYLNRVPLSTEEQTTYLRGYVESSGYNYRGKKYLILSDMQNFDGAPLEGKIRLTPLNLRENINTGDCVETVAVIRPLMMPNMRHSYQFNRRQYFEGLKATAYTDVSVNPIDCRDIGISRDIVSPLVAKLREKVVARIYQTLPPETAGITAAIVAGERGKISQPQTKDYRDSGLAHFLSISGLHMGMIAGLMFLLIRRGLSYIPSLALKHDTKKIAAAVAIVMSFVYLIISGGQISAQRAFIMTALVLLGVLVGRKAISMRMIAFAALIILIFEPQVLISAGFQMSFAAVIMLVAFYEKHAAKVQNFWHVNKADVWLIRAVKITIVYLTGIVVADFIASMATLPFAIYHFNRVSVYTSIANLAAGPIIGLWIMPSVLISLLLMPFGLDKYPLLLTGEGIDKVNNITHWVSGLDNASYQVVAMPAWGLGLIVIGGLWLALWQSRWRHFGWLGIILGFLSICCVREPDVLVDAKAKTFAVKAPDGKMLILPNRGNYFTKQMWQERLAQRPLTEDDRQTLRQIYKGRKTNPQFVDLLCDEKQCTYKKRIVLHKRGGVKIDNQDYTDHAAFEVYFEDNQPVVKTVSSWIGNRFWTLP